MKTTVFMKEFDGRRVYSKAVKFSKDGEDKYAYFTLRFRKGIELANKTKIEIKNSFLGWQPGKDGKEYWYEFVEDFETVAGDLPQGFEEISDDDIPFD
jgi:hypothetical protein